MPGRLVSGLRAGVVGLALLAPSACEWITGPGFPDDAVRVDPPAAYRSWWTLTEQCSGRRGDFDAVRWYTYPDHELPSGHQGYWYDVGNRIVIVEPFRHHGQLVRHEMLHALLGSGGHPPRYFRDACGGVVSCERCFPPWGGPPQPGPASPVIDVHELDVALSTWPPDPSRSRDSGWVTFIISARNPRPEPVWVRLEPTQPRQLAARTFGVDHLAGQQFGFVLDTIIALGPGEEMRESIDQRVWWDSSGVVGWYNAKSTPPVPVVIAP